MVARRRRLVLHLYVGAVGALAVSLVGWAAPRVDWAVAGWLILAVLVAEAFSSSLRDEVMVSLTNIVSLVAILLAGGPELAIVAALGSLPVFVSKVSDQRIVRVAFNTGQFVVSAAAGGAIYLVLISVFDASFPAAVALVAVLVAGITSSTINHVLVAGVIAVSSADRFLDTFRTIGPSLALQIPYVGIAILTVVVLERASAWALVLMAVPALIARYGLLSFQRLDRSYDELVRSLVKAIEIKDLYTRGHSERVSTLSVHVAEELGLGYEQRRLARYAALLHDVGKIGVPLCVINKPGPLDEDEFEQIKRHPALGAEILRDIDFLEPALDVVRYHHERLDGRGYPHGVGGDALSQLVRIVTAVDAFDAMTSTRSYRRALPVAAAVAELRRCSGGQFDGEVVDALTRCVERLAWQPVEDFASEAQLHGHEIPRGTAQERLIDGRERARGWP
jgi:putative nucleotidyltransferase with HDIG domain